MKKRSAQKRAQGSIKTAVSLERRLFDRGEKTAKQMNISRSRLYAQALDDYLRRKETQAMVESINAAYAYTPEDEESQFLRAAARQQFERLAAEEAEPW